MIDDAVRFWIFAAVEPLGKANVLRTPQIVDVFGVIVRNPYGCVI